MPANVCFMLSTLIADLYDQGCNAWVKFKKEIISFYHPVHKINTFYRCKSEKSFFLIYST